MRYEMYEVTMILMLNNQDPETQDTMKIYFLPSEEIIPKVKTPVKKTKVDKDGRMIFKDHIHKF